MCHLWPPGGCTAQGGVNPMEWQPAVQDDVCDLLEGIFLMHAMILLLWELG